MEENCTRYAWPVTVLKPGRIPTVRNLELGKEIFQRDCADCHGYNGEGDAKKHVPVIHGQHYRYLERQYAWIRSGLRRNSNKEMVEQIQGYSLREEDAVLSYTASLLPPGSALQAPRM